jgi:hypothetical protein
MQRSEASNFVLPDFIASKVQKDFCSNVPKVSKTVMNI